MRRWLVVLPQRILGKQRQTVHTDDSNTGSSRRRIGVKQEDLEDLYLLVQGAPYANTVVDAKAALALKDYSRTLQLMQSARERYRQSHGRILRQEFDRADDDKSRSKEQARQRQRQGQCRSVLAEFDEVIATLQRMVQMRAGKSPSASAHPGSTAASESTSRLPPKFRREYESSHSTRGQIAAIRRHFEVQKVESVEHIDANELYYLRGKEHAYLICVSEVEPGQEMVPIRLALSGQVMKPISKQKFLELGMRQKLLRLVPKAADSAGSQDDAGDLLAEPRQDSRRSEGMSDDDILDKGAFSQLLDAAQRSGLVPNANLIAHTRDREFRLRHYQKAFQVIEGLYGKFSAAAMQREQRLKREDMDIAQRQSQNVSQATIGETIARHSRDAVGRPRQEPVSPGAGRIARPDENLMPQWQVMDQSVLRMTKPVTGYTRRTS